VSRGDLTEAELRLLDDLIAGRTRAPEPPGYLIADKGYDSDAIRDSLHEAGVRPVIPPHANRAAMDRWNKWLYRQRNRIERIIGHLKINRAIATRYDKLARSFLDMLHLAALRRLLRHATL